MTTIARPTVARPTLAVPRLRLSRPRPVAVRPALPAQRLQARLVAHGMLAPEAASARLDRPTLDAVARFQAHRGLRVDGVPGPATCDALLATSARRA